MVRKRGFRPVFRDPKNEPRVGRGCLILFQIKGGGGVTVQVSALAGLALIPIRTNKIPVPTYFSQLALIRITV